MKDYKFIHLTKDEHIAVVAMAYEPVNALSFEFLAELGECFDELENEEDVWAVVLCSDVKLFAAGADLKNLLTAGPEGNRAVAESMLPVFRKIENFPHPVVCAVNGGCFGGGLELALSCDLRVFDVKTKVGLTEATLGICPGAGGTQRLPKLIGVGAAKRLMFTGEIIRGEEAYRLGICEYLAEEGRLRETAIEVAEKICACAPKAVAADKHLINYSREHTNLEEELTYMTYVTSEVFNTEDKNEGIKAFFEKRPAVFNNR